MDLDYINNYYYMFYNGMEHIKTILKNLLIRNQELEYNILLLKDMNQKITELNDKLVNDNTIMKQQFDNKGPLLPLPTQQ